MAMDVSILKNSNKCSLKLPIVSHKTCREQSIRERPNLTTRELIEKLSYLSNESNFEKRLGVNLSKNDVKVICFGLELDSQTYLKVSIHR